METYFVVAHGQNVEAKVGKILISVGVGFTFGNSLKLGPGLTLEAKLGCHDQLLEFGDNVQDQCVYQFFGSESDREV